MASGLPPGLEAAELLGKRHLLGRTRSRAGPAASRENLFGPVHIECLRPVLIGGNRGHFSQAVALRRIYRRVAPILFLGMPDTRPPDPAACLRAASLHKRRRDGGTVPGAECKNASVRKPGSNGYCGALAEMPPGHGNDRAAYAVFGGLFLILEPNLGPCGVYRVVDVDGVLGHHAGHCAAALTGQQQRQPSTVSAPIFFR